MIPLFSTSQVREFDSYAINSLKVPGIVLMENAAKNISSSILKKFNDIKSVGLICGKGNNGGDGFAVARHLSNSGLSVLCLYLGDEKEMSEDCRINFNILLNLSKRRKNIQLKKFNSLNDLNKFKQVDLIVDAILGSGFSGELKEPILSIIKKINSFSNKKVAVDVPTGLNADTGYSSTVFKSDLTITLGELKKGLYISNGYESCGEIILEEIGVGRDYFNDVKTSTFLVESKDVYELLPKRSKSLNKYTAGKVLSITGSYEYPGAGILTSKAAFKVGAGAVILSIPEIVKKYVYKNLPEVVIQIYGDKSSKWIKPDNYDDIKSKIKWADVVAVGCGLGREEETIEFVDILLSKKEFKFCVIDADALYSIKDNLDKYDLTKCILTPHLGEFSSLIKESVDEIKKDVIKYGSEFAKKYKTTLVLKGAPTITFNSNGESFINSTGNSGLAKFGSGDVLTGMVAGFLSQSKDIFSSAILSVYLHGLAADLLKNKKTEFGILASDIINEIPNSINLLRSLY
ncbi:MAG: NAD(P)H-hydrate dehydratase [Ignavibacterium sp.]|nr:NAD(P)H-hydrate dehydratase [Ignavibacterium sp.]